MFDVFLTNWWTIINYFIQISPKNKSLQDIFAEITVQKITKATIILILAYGGLIVSEKLINWVSERVPRQFRINIKQSLPVLRALILVVASVTLLNLFLDISANNLLTLTGTAVVALGFAFKDYASSVIAGIVALFEAPYRVGDRVNVADQYGEVVNYGLRGIQIKTPDDSRVTIPHNKLWTDAITNTNNGKLEAQIVTNFYLDHQVKVEQVMDILYQAAYTSKYSQIKLPVVVSLEEKPWGTAFHLKSYVMDAREEYEYKTDLIKRVKQAFAESNFVYPKLLDRPV